MGLKGTKINSIIDMSCPRCQESKLFTDSNPYNFNTLFDMPEHCPSCGLKFISEPGFFYGAMYVSYGVSVAHMISMYVALLVLYPSFSITFYLILGIGTLLLLTPYYFRLSRAIWINFFKKYDPKASEEWKKTKKRNAE